MGRRVVVDGKTNHLFCRPMSYALLAGGGGRGRVGTTCTNQADTETRAHRQTDREKCRYRQIHRQLSKPTDSHTDKHTDTQTNVHTDRQTYRHTQTSSDAQGSRHHPHMRLHCIINLAGCVAFPPEQFNSGNFVGLCKSDVVHPQRLHPFRVSARD